MDYDDVRNPLHPITINVPSILYGGSASHGHFLNLIPGTDVVIVEDGTTQPTTIEYNLGAGTVIATTMPWEYAYHNHWDFGQCLPNAIAYALTKRNNRVAIHLNPTLGWTQFLPPSGGSINYFVQIVNHSDTLTAANAQIDLRYPDGSLGSGLGPFSFPAMQPGFNLSRIRNWNIPALFPAGQYHLIASLRNNADSLYDADSIIFVKNASVDGFDLPEVAVSQLPEQTSIQCSPNPFNPTTVIRYELQAASYTSLKVYNTCGKLVSSLLNGMGEAGSHEVTFDGSSLPSGVYLYHLQAGGQNLTGKMVLAK
jgi:hypothetical protein